MFTLEVKLRLQENIIYALPFPVASFKLKLIEEMDKDQKKEMDKARSNVKSQSSAPAAPKKGHVKLPTVNSLKISR